MSKKKVIPRRRPMPVQTEAVPQVRVLCPACGHKIVDHNQCGCCFTEEVCPCLKTREEIE